MNCEQNLSFNEIITKEFVQNALESEANGAPVPEIISHSATLGTKPGDNYMSVIYSVDVTLSDGTKRHLLIKCYPSHPKRQEFANKSNMFFRECEVYSKWIPELQRLQREVFGPDKDEAVKLPYAKFVHGQCINFQSEEGKNRLSAGPINSLDNFIILNDLRKTDGFRMANRLQPLDMDHMNLLISALARVHGLSWAYRSQVEADITGKFSFLKSNKTEKSIIGWNKVMLSSLAQAKDMFDKEFGLGNDCSVAADRFKEHVDATAKLLLGICTAEGMEKRFRIKEPDQEKFGRDAENPEPWRIICHGDCWINNMLFRYDPVTGKPLEIVLVDLQLVQETCLVNDLSYVTHVCARLERSQLDNLLHLYHDTFNSVCKKLRTPTLPGFCMDSLRFRFHRAKFLGYYTAMLDIPIMLKETKVGDMEDMEEGQDVAGTLAELCSDAGSNARIKERLVEITKKMIEDGVL